MAKVAVVFWSGTDNTEQMADAVALGVKENGGESKNFLRYVFAVEYTKTHHKGAFLYFYFIFFCLFRH